jgi:nitrate reductase cytochrome c-type subunit
MPGPDPPLTMRGLPENFRQEPPSTPKKLNHHFATESTKRCSEVHDGMLGEHPQLRQSSVSHLWNKTNI